MTHMCYFIKRQSKPFLFWCLSVHCDDVRDDFSHRSRYTFYVPTKNDRNALNPFKAFMNISRQFQPEFYTVRPSQASHPGRLSSRHFRVEASKFVPNSVWQHTANLFVVWVFVCLGIFCVSVQRHEKKCITRRDAAFPYLFRSVFVRIKNIDQTVLLRLISLSRSLHNSFVTCSLSLYPFGFCMINWMRRYLVCMYFVNFSVELWLCVHSKMVEIKL